MTLLRPTSLAVMAGLAVTAPAALAQTGNQWSLNPAPVQPPPASSGQVWGPSQGGTGSVYAPADLDDQLRGSAGAQARAVPAVPVQPAMPGYPYQAAPGVQPYGYGMPYGAGYGAPYSGYGGYGGYGAPGYGVPFYGYDLPGSTVFPFGSNTLAPGYGAWGNPYTPYGGVPFFGGSPFGFW